MTFLIDTHILLWAALKPERLDDRAAALLKSLDSSPAVSAASVYEISQKVRRGKLPEAIEFENKLLQNIAHMGYSVLPIEPEVMLRAARFESNHADPFDRIIAAHAIHLDVGVLSADSKLDSFGVRRL